MNGQECSIFTQNPVPVGWDEYYEKAFQLGEKRENLGKHWCTKFNIFDICGPDLYLRKDIEIKITEFYYLGVFKARKNRGRPEEPITKCQFKEDVKND